MSYEKRKEDHLYHAFALGAGGYIERDRKKTPFPIAAPNALSVSGGSGVNEQSNYKFVLEDPNRKRAANFFMTIGNVVTEVAAAETEDGWVTTGRAELTDLNINGVVKADFVRANLTSFHTKRKSLRSKKLEAPVSAKGSEFKNLTVNGIPVRLTLDEVIQQHETHEKLHKFIAGKQKTSESFRKRHFLQASGKKDDYICDMERFNNASHFRCSIFGEIVLGRQSDDVRQHCYSLDIRNFGRLYIGELIVSHGSKRLNMLRFDLGCDNCGGGTGGSADVNGATMP